MIQRVTSYRASKILYNFLKVNIERVDKPFFLPVNVCSDVPRVFEEAKIPYSFVDIDSQTLCMDTQYVLTHANEISGILMVHTYGVEIDFSDFYDRLRNINPAILIVDDRCLCVPLLEPHLYGADLVLYSFSAKKQVNLSGGAMGYVVDKLNYQDCIVSPDSYLLNVSWSFDEDEVREKIKSAISHREKLNAIYRNSLPKDIQLPEEYQHWRFNIMVDNKQIVMQGIFDAGLFASSHYALAASQSDADKYSNARYSHEHVVNLFNDGYFTENQAKECCLAINFVLEHMKK